MAIRFNAQGLLAETAQAFFLGRPLRSEFPIPLVGQGVREYLDVPHENLERDGDPVVLHVYDGDVAGVLGAGQADEVGPADIRKMQDNRQDENNCKDPGIHCIHFE